MTTPRWQQNCLFGLLVATALYLFFSKPENRAALHRHIGNTSYQLATTFGALGMSSEVKYHAIVSP